jgi:hypothetical protein
MFLHSTVPVTMSIEVGDFGHISYLVIIVVVTEKSTWLSSCCYNVCPFYVKMKGNNKKKQQNCNFINNFNIASKFSFQMSWFFTLCTGRSTWGYHATLLWQPNNAVLSQPSISPDCNCCWTSGSFSNAQVIILYGNVQLNWCLLISSQNTCISLFSQNESTFMMIITS